MTDELPMVGDGVTAGIVRVGDTVRRPVRPFTATIQSYLTHLRARGFEGAPLALGYDERGREVLSYLPGDVPREPLPAEATTDDVLVELARMIRRLHDAAAAGWSVPDNAVWGAIPGAVDDVVDAPELVGHMDYCPGNVVFRNGSPVALIDFDLARPTTRVRDIANALYWWAPLLDPVDRAPSLIDSDVVARVRLFADAYGMTERQRVDLVPVAIAMVGRSHRTAREAAIVDPVFQRMWDEGVRDRMPRAERWLADHADAIAAGLCTERPPTS